MRTPKFQLGQTVTLKGQSVFMSVIAIIHVTRIDEIETIEYQLRNQNTMQLAQAFEQELSIWTSSGNEFPPDWFIKNNPTPPPRDKKSEDLMNMIRQANTLYAVKQEETFKSAQIKQEDTGKTLNPIVPGACLAADRLDMASPDYSVPDPSTLMEKKSGDSNILEFKPSDSCKVGKNQQSEQTIDDGHKNFDYE